MEVAKSMSWLDDSVKPNRVHGSVYTDQKIFEEELEKIWYRTWVYIGHVSEVPEPNDFVMKSIGPQPVIMTRDRHGEIHLLQNRCSHRGNRVVFKPRGNAKNFTCSYHGWVFGNNGELKGVPFEDGMPSEGINAELGLGRVPRIGIYRGFVFGSLAPEGPSLDEHLGNAKRALDQLCENSPTGEVEITAGFLAHKVVANWKFLAENETDGYHPAFTHSSIFSVAESRIGEIYSNESTALTRYMGDGHSEVDLRPEFRKRDEPLSWFGTTADRLPGYVAAMNQAYGPGEARRIMIDGSPHIYIFPNLFIAEIQIFVFQPLAVNETVQHCTAIQFKGAPDINRRLRQQTMGSVGPAGFLLADDAEMYERSHLGVQDKYPEWVYLGRGEHREQTEADGSVIGSVTDDGCSRGFWRNYRKLMGAQS